MRVVKHLSRRRSCAVQAGSDRHRRQDQTPVNYEDRSLPIDSNRPAPAGQVSPDAPPGDLSVVTDAETVPPSFAGQSRFSVLYPRPDSNRRYRLERGSRGHRTTLEISETAGQSHI
jgi:hypothetical protein